MSIWQLGSGLKLNEKRYARIGIRTRVAGSKANTSGIQKVILVKIINIEVMHNIVKVGA